MPLSLTLVKLTSSRPTLPAASRRLCRGVPSNSFQLLSWLVAGRMLRGRQNFKNSMEREVELNGLEH